MSANGTELVVRVGKSEGGMVTVTVEAGGEPLHTDRIRMAEAAERERFVAAVCAGRPGIDRAALAGLLGKEAARWGAPAAVPTAARPVEVYQEFPVDLLPAPVPEFVRAVSEGTCCALAMVALPVLAVLASSIGNTRRVRIGESWAEPMILWPVVLAESGEVKTPAFKAAMNLLYELQGEAEADYQRQKTEYDAALARYDVELSEWKRNKDRDPNAPPEKPAEPEPRDYFTADTTVEAVALMLKRNPRGGLLARDELSGFFQSFNQYRGGKGGDEAGWLELYTSGTFKVNRASGKRLFVPHASCSIVGTIQPDVFREAMQGRNTQNGLAARFLLAMPPAPPKVLRRAGYASAAGAYRELVRRLLSIPQEISADGTNTPVPADVRLSNEAYRLAQEFVKQHAMEREQQETPALRFAWAKLEAAAFRLALLVHLVKCAGDGGGAMDPLVLDTASLQAGIELARWFGREARRVYLRGHETADAATARALAEYIGVRGGRMTPRTLAQNKRRQYPDTAAAEAAMELLVRFKLARWEYHAPGPDGGQPSKELVLCANDTPAGGVETGGNVGANERERGEL